jgi:hypothetical protein
MPYFSFFKKVPLSDAAGTWPISCVQLGTVDVPDYYQTPKWPEQLLKKS